jgi:hypothetical protein
VHFDTFLAVLMVFWGDVCNIFEAWGYALRHPSTTVWLESYREDPFFRPGGSYLVLGTNPVE